MTSDWEKTEKRKYDNAYGKWAWGDMCRFPKASQEKWNRILTVTAYSFKKWVDVGCGPAYGIAYGKRMGLEVYGSDISEVLSEMYWKPQGIADRCFVAPVHRQPFKDGEFDFTACFDVLEHIPEEGIMDSLNELRRISSGVFIYSIALTTDHGPMGKKWKKSHLTVKPKGWWIERLENTGHNIVKKRISNGILVDIREDGYEDSINDYGALYVLGYFGKSKRKAESLKEKLF